MGRGKARKHMRYGGNLLERSYRENDKASTTITFANQDIKFARWLADAFDKEGRDVWVDWDNSPPTAEWIAQVYKEIESNDCFIFVLSPNSVNAEDCAWAVDHALKSNKRIIPVVFQDVDPIDVRSELQRLQFVFFREDGDNWPRSLAKLSELMDENMKHLRCHTALLTAATRWETEDFDKSLLLEGPDLHDARDWVNNSSLGALPIPTELHLSFVSASRTLLEIMRLRKLIAIFFLIIVGIGIVFPSWGVFFFALIFAHIFVYFSSK